MGKLSKIDKELLANYKLAGNTIISKNAEFLTEIGDEKQPDDFYPQVKVKRWDNESNFSMRLQDVGDHKKGKVSSKKDKTTWEGGGKKVELYPVSDCFGSGCDGYEFMIVLDASPSKNVLTFSIQTKGLLFFYQPPLTDSPEDQRSVRPDHIVGSYAVYHRERKKHNQYKTGKAFHIYRPHITDADGNETWGDLNINEKAGELTVTIPQAWMDSAVYPIRVDPTIGYDTAGGTFDSGGNYCVWSRFTSPEAGDANPGTFYWYGANTSTGGTLVNMVGAYDDNGGNPDNLLASAGPFTALDSAQWHSGAITWTGILDATDYHLAVNSDVDGGNQSGYYYDTVTPGYEDGHWQSRIHSNDLPDPAGTLAAIAREYSFYVEYSEASSNRRIRSSSGMGFPV